MKPSRSRSHLDWVRGLSCCYCSAPPPSDPHHFGPRGVGQKTSDYRTVPLCRGCHDQFHARGTLGSMPRDTTKDFIVGVQLSLLERRIMELLEDEE